MKGEGEGENWGIQIGGERQSKAERRGEEGARERESNSSDGRAREQSA